MSKGFLCIVYVCLAGLTGFIIGQDWRKTHLCESPKTAGCLCGTCLCEHCECGTKRPRTIHGNGIWHSKDCCQTVDDKDILKKLLDERFDAQEVLAGTYEPIPAPEKIPPIEQEPDIQLDKVKHNNPWSFCPYCTRNDIGWSMYKREDGISVLVVDEVELERIKAPRVLLDEEVFFVPRHSHSGFQLHHCWRRHKQGCHS